MLGNFLNFSWNLFYLDNFTKLIICRKICNYDVHSFYQALRRYILSLSLSLFLSPFLSLSISSILYIYLFKSEIAISRATQSLYAGLRIPSRYILASSIFVKNTPRLGWRPPHAYAHASKSPQHCVCKTMPTSRRDDARRWARVLRFCTNFYITRGCETREILFMKQHERRTSTRDPWENFFLL